MLTILMRMTNLLLRTQFMHAILFGQCNGQCKWRAINWTVEISKMSKLIQIEFETIYMPLASHSQGIHFQFHCQYQRTFVYASILSSCHRNALAKKIPFRLPFEVPSLVASVSVWVIVFFFWGGTRVSVRVRKVDI